MNKRLIDFLTVKDGLRAYFGNRYSQAERDGFYVRYFDEPILILSERTGITHERIVDFLDIAFNTKESGNIDEAKYPTSVEFDKMMFVEKCNDSAAIELQDRLNNEYLIFVKENTTKSMLTL